MDLLQDFVFNILLHSHSEERNNRTIMYITNTKFNGLTLQPKRDEKGNIVYKKDNERKIIDFLSISIPCGSPCSYINGIIYWNNIPICFDTSQVAYDYFSINCDGCGLKRGELVHNIKNELAKIDDKHQARWDRLWDNETELAKFRRADSPEHWIWNYDFYNAKIADLEHIYDLIKEVE